MDKLFGIGPNGLNYTGSKSSFIQILTTDWNNLTCTKTVAGMTPNLAVIISPEANSIDTYSKAGVKCTAQGMDSLTFTCKTIPTENITVNILMIAVIIEGSGLNRLEVSGDWTNDQYAGDNVDYTGLTFTAVFNDGTSKTVYPTSISPTQWGNTVGTQTCTFSYSQEGVTVTTTKNATVLKKLSSLTIEGTWVNSQYINNSVDYTGLIFTAHYSDGTTSTVSPSSYTPTMWGSTVGTQVCTFSYTEGGVNVTANKEVYVVRAPIITDSWDTIKSRADAGLAAQYYSVGDDKEISVAAGTIDGKSISASKYRAVIIGINHNPTLENPNSIDFAIGQSMSGVEICFGGFRMNNSQTTTGGWTGSQMYLTYLPQFYNLLSGNTGLQSAMIAPKKYTNNVSGGPTSNIESYVTLSEDPNYKLFLMSEYEIFGYRTYSNTYEQTKQVQYEYYSSSGLARSQVRMAGANPPYMNSSWWERSPTCSETHEVTYYFCLVNDDGSAAGVGANVSSGVGFCPCFRV